MDQQLKKAALACCIALTGCATVSVRDPAAAVQPPPPVTIKALLPFRFCKPPCADVMAEKHVTAPADTQTAVAHPKSDIFAVGFASIAAQPSTDPAQQRLMAARASKLDAYRNLYEQVFGISINSTSAMDGHALNREGIRTNISGTLRGVEIVSIEPLGTDTYQTTLKLSADTNIELR